MRLRHRPPAIDATPATLSPGLQHLDQRWVAVLRWLSATRLDHVVVGPVAHAIRGELTAHGAVAVVPAPYLRNYERLAEALTAHGATLRSDRGRRSDGAVEVKFTADTLARGRRWLLRIDGHDLDLESSVQRAAGVHGPHEPAAATGDGARYQELLYESARIQIATGLAVEVAAPEDLEHFSHLRRTGIAPEFRVTRAPERADGSVPETQPAESSPGS